MQSLLSENTEIFLGFVLFVGAAFISSSSEKSEAVCFCAAASSFFN